jgi:hypothetical protein
MNRRLFLQFPFVASLMIREGPNQKDDRAKRGFKIEKGKDRFQEELLVMGGQFDCKVSGKDTNGDLYIYDTLRNEKGDPLFIFTITRMNDSILSKVNLLSK